MKGINDDELILQEQTLHTEDTVNEPHEEGSRTDLFEPATESLQPEEKDNCWKDFMTYLENDESNPDKTERLVCKLDRDLADSLDDCNIRNRCRSDLDNGIQELSSRTGTIPPGEEITLYSLQSICV